MSEDDEGRILGDDRTQLVDEDVRTRSMSCCTCIRHKRLLLFLVALVLIISGHVVAIYFAHFKERWTCNPEEGNCVPDFKVLSFNTWGMPENLGSQHKTERMNAIAQELSKGEFDLYLFEELWMRPDYWTLQAKLPTYLDVATNTTKKYEITEYWKLTNGKCDGRIGPDGCSGLTVVSKYPIKEVEFYLYHICGNPSKIFVDGECLASKGVGRIRLENPGNLTDVKLDVYITHTVAQPPSGHGYDNIYYRVKQVEQLVEEILKKSTADAIILGGDFNTGPDFKKGTPYQIIQDYMENSLEDVYYRLRQWLQPRWATYANERNTWSFGIGDPITYDFIFHRNQNRSRVHLFTNWFKMPFFTTPFKGQNISLSDHEPVSSSFTIKQLTKPPPVPQEGD